MVFFFTFQNLTNLLVKFPVHFSHFVVILYLRNGILRQHLIKFSSVLLLALLHIKLRRFLLLRRLWNCLIRLLNDCWSRVLFNAVVVERVLRDWKGILISSHCRRYLVSALYVGELLINSVVLLLISPMLRLDFWDIGVLERACGLSRPSHLLSRLKTPHLVLLLLDRGLLVIVLASCLWSW